MKFIHYTTITLFILVSLLVGLCGCKEKTISLESLPPHKIDTLHMYSIDPPIHLHGYVNCYIRFHGDTVYIHDTIYRTKTKKRTISSRPYIFCTPSRGDLEIYGNKQKSILIDKKGYIKLSIDSNYYGVDSFHVSPHKF